MDCNDPQSIKENPMIVLYRLITEYNNGVKTQHIERYHLPLK